MTASPDGGPVKAWTNPKKGFLFFVGFAAIGAGMGQLAPAVLTLALKSTEIVGEKASAGTLSLVIAISAVVSLILAPLYGRFSDRIRGRLGRRRPLLILGAILFAIGGVLMAIATSVPVLLIGAIVTFAGAAAVTVAVTAIIPDQFEPLRRGPASAIIGVSLPVGAVIGLGLANAVSFSLTLQVLVPAAVAVIGIALFAIVVRDPQVADAPRPPFNAVQFFSTFWVNPAKNPSFAWAWFSRFLIFFGVAAIQAYQIYYLLDVLKVGSAATEDVFLSTLILTVFALVFAAIAAKISDIVKRRKPFVIIAAVIFAIGLAVAATSTSITGFFVAIGIVGLGQGVYFAVDLALVSQLVPDPSNPGQGMSIMGLATTLPQSVVPAIAPAVLAIGASAATPQNFPALFIVGAIAGLIGAVLILPIRKVK